MSEVFFIADTHFNHANIIKHAERPFYRVEDMNEYMINQWNNTVSPDDTVMFLGDFLMGRQPKVNLKLFMERLNGLKFLIRGNHDKFSNQTYLDAGFQTVHDSLAYFLDNSDKFLVLTHRPLSSFNFAPNPSLRHLYTRKNAVSIYGHTHEIGDPHCVSVENINYTPISLSELREILDI